MNEPPPTSSPRKRRPSSGGGNDHDGCFVQRHERDLGSRFRGDDDRGKDVGLTSKLLILLVKAWQRGPSALLPPSCRFQPSCSAYAITALRRYGPLKGGWLAIRRIGRCHPWGGFGPDPVP